MHPIFGILTLAFLVTVAPARANELARPDPETSTGFSASEASTFSHEVVVAAHPLAADAGFAILKQGGSALDAAIAVQAMLTLVEPQSSGIGGGAFLLYWDAQAQQLHAYDGRETAPSNATSQLFISPDGDAMRWIDAVIGGRAVGAPGVLRMLELAHSRHGKLAWATLFEPAIKQSKEGFLVGERLHQLINQSVNPGLGRYPEARDYFFTETGAPLPVGTRRDNPALAQTLIRIAAEGADALYTGPLARQIAERVHNVTDNPGYLTEDDLANYRAVERTPLCQSYRSYRVCGFPPPTSGGATLLQILGIMENFAPQSPQSTDFAHLFTQASRLAYADRAQYLADPDFVQVPVKALLDKEYLQHRAALIDPNKDMGKAAAGEPVSLSRSDDRSPELPSTSHFVIVDQAGNAVSITSSIEHAFGSTLMVGGFLLNNQLTDFSFQSERDGQPIANRVEPGKRPRSSMAPVMIFDAENRLVGAIGSPGGSHIINYVAQSVIAMIDSDLSLQAIVSLPHISNRNGSTALEDRQISTSLLDALESRGHTLDQRSLNSGLHGVRRLPDGRWETGVDPRREGKAVGR
ncbi:MAG: gamma-glutamyltransferase [Oceanospirillaceae bacterium]|nr:gamma-glutamyltransferase [Oceanospirillaceae bacterium]